MKAYQVWVMALAVVGAAVALASREAGSQKGGDVRVAEISHLMEGINKSNMSRLSAAIKRGAPGSDKEWKSIEMAAALLNEVGHAIDVEGRRIDDVWADGAAQLRASSAAMLMAALDQDYDAAKKALPLIAASCKTCHDVHKEDI